MQANVTIGTSDTSIEIRGCDVYTRGEFAGNIECVVISTPPLSPEALLPCLRLRLPVPEEPAPLQAIAYGDLPEGTSLTFHSAVVEGASLPPWRIEVVWVDERGEMPLGTLEVRAHTEGLAAQEEPVPSQQAAPQPAEQAQERKLCRKCGFSYTGTQCPRCLRSSLTCCLAIVVLIAACTAAVVYFVGQKMNRGAPEALPPAPALPAEAQPPVPAPAPGPDYGKALAEAKALAEKAGKSGDPKDWEAALEAARSAVRAPAPDTREAQALLAEAKARIADIERARNTSYLTLPQTATDAQLAEAARLYPNLTQLEMPYCREVTDLSPIETLKRLKSLNIMNCDKVRDLSVLAELPELVEFVPNRALTNEGLAQVARGAPKLRRLDLEWASSVTDFSPLARLTGLESLSLPPLTTDADLGRVVADHPNLSALSLRLTVRIKDYAPLARLTKLREFFPPRSTATQIAVIIEFTPNITELVIVDAQDLNDLAFLARLPRLNSLCLSSCRGLNDLSGLKQAKVLAGLRIVQCNDLSDLTPVGELPNLASLNIQFCDGISSLKPVARVKGLKQFILYGCPEIPQAEIDALKRELPGCQFTIAGR